MVKMRSRVQGAHKGEYRVWDCSVSGELLQGFWFLNNGMLKTMKRKTQQRSQTAALLG